MKSEIFFWLLFSFFYTAITVNGQKPVYPKPNSSDQIPFGKKLPPPVLNAKDASMGKTYDRKMKGLPYTSFDTVLKQFIVSTPGQQSAQYPASRLYSKSSAVQTVNNPKNSSFCFHLTKDINTTGEGSHPSNYPAGRPHSFAMLNNISYFSADDGIHGTELWRSDGTPAGTYLVKDIKPGEAGSQLSDIIAANGLLFFFAATTGFDFEPWVSDGTELGTHLLKDLNMGIDGSFPNQFIDVSGSVFFITSFYGYNNQLWKTDGTEGGTMLVKDIQQADNGYAILELVAVNDMAYFIAFTWASGYQLFRSDGTDAGTYMVKQIGFYQNESAAPMQLTAYNNKLYFSADDGTGRRLWTSDGTEDGTGYATGYNDVYMEQNYLNIYSNTPFLILNNVLYMAGFTPAEGSGLYKYDASNSDGIVLVKDVTAGGTGMDYIVPVDMRVVNDAIYFKVIMNTNDSHDELWITKGETANTQPVKLFIPGEYIYNFYNGNGTFYFVKYDNVYGNELWKSDGTDPGTLLVSDINPGSSGSFPSDLTFFNGKLLFSATDNNSGNELWTSNGTGIGTSLVKDINSTTTKGSDAGFIYKGIATSGKGVVFGAFTPELGVELYKSDGTSTGTQLLNDIAAGEQWSYPNSFIFKNGVNYFIGDNSIGTSIYKTDGTTEGLQKIVFDIDRVVYYVTNFNVTDNGLPFYILANRFTGAYELWRSDGTEAGTYVLTPNVNYNSYIITIGNTAFFVAGDDENGFELWKSDGTLAGTRMVNDINQGINGSYPYSLFAYKKDIYFGAWDGGLNNSFWKSDGTVKGTIKLKSITPAYYDYNNNYATQFFCISNNILYFNATDFNTYGAELWKTNGTQAGTKLVKNINPNYDSYPANLTDVKGTLYFTADDGVHGSELWSSDGTSHSTKMVKDITPDINSSYLDNLCSADGMLYFLNNGVYPNTLWSSDGTANNTNQVTDEGLGGRFNIFNLTPAGNKLFFGVYSYKYGSELYVGDACATIFTAAKVSSSDMLPTETNTTFDVLLYPNPAHGSASLQIKGNAKDITVTIADISGKVISQKTFANTTQVSLPVEKLTAGIYMVTVKSGSDKKTLKFVKQ